VLEELTKWNMLAVNEGMYQVTRLGRVSATLYYWPSDVRHWAVAFDIINRYELWNSDLAVSYVLGTTPTMKLDYVPRQEMDRVEAYNSGIEKIWPSDRPNKSTVISNRLHDLITSGESSPYVRAMQGDIDRIAQALTWIDGIKGWKQPNFWKALPIRIKYGVGKELVDLCSIPGIGGARARKLYAEGVVSRKDILARKVLVRKVIGENTAQKVFEECRMP